MEVTMIHRKSSFFITVSALVLSTAIVTLYSITTKPWETRIDFSLSDFENERSDSNIENEQFLRSLDIYYRCSLLSVSDVLRGSEIDFCMHHYINIKLSFINDMDQPKFEQLPSKERAIVNSGSYKKFKQWEISNPLIVKQSKENSRERMSLFDLSP